MVNVIFKHFRVLKSFLSVRAACLKYSADWSKDSYRFSAHWYECQFNDLQALLLARELKQSVVLWSPPSRTSRWVRCDISITDSHQLARYEHELAKALIWGFFSAVCVWEIHTDRLFIFSLHPEAQLLGFWLNCTTTELFYSTLYHHRHWK